ncbi:hypothetical protein GGTG_13540 [Gaeumannomyces tritici R3-111a-1]|uniref:Uncharacterized protein n=1 Tax=Gaeumannomyces tritici (strain R3-111a-1) TaxID=644352 RepID=J3PJ58_GAET3|nr:hypothetical protein GGTG_13540 [Gaeumannomyces tritici R3-111a-1]EJT68876.1 hypothetical protein GGTG_13540 [Gaeumannomyces tritici R3-111a-1]
MMHGRNFNSTCEPPMSCPQPAPGFQVQPMNASPIASAEQASSLAGFPAEFSFAAIDHPLAGFLVAVRLLLSMGIPLFACYLSPQVAAWSFFPLPTHS